VKVGIATLPAGVRNDILRDIDVEMEK